ncbi:thioredoxin family protein [Staphylococcus delphini]|uniref:thioredoxin family protein n=1 Tax=Staphylococcus delphini TaxID=53344 RepID=UPI000BBBF40E|nr:thioredoxin family protein [Staphylococcus delphini]MDE9752110.1 thioredoxin family protein [Staphylococcus delphini]MDE9789605.1 thioredoxin family protein [Staphylococcus delphini]MDE9792044.1 thioredoxin family protein [Staphylococcus delphini]MDE9794319.1 thioredoxin family protein [Staphylococcus delphini]MDE9796632.1 thioredoxin family protein [Staphylococcus delphini]
MQSIKNMESFNEVIQSNEPVIVKFEAGWCPDCRAMDMWIDPIVEKYNQYEWYTVNRDELEEATTQYEVMGIPSLLIFQNGEKLHHLHSAHAKSPEQVESYLAESLG